jgi:[ribosomal protein S18]-alanine N-acetyltransferase
VRMTGDARSFAVGRVVLDEAEVLTLATHPDHRRQGLARAALADLTRQCEQAAVTRLFLEVAANNAAALALYHRAGFAVSGRRKGYYGGTDALTMVRVLPESATTATGP